LKTAAARDERRGGNRAGRGGKSQGSLEEAIPLCIRRCTKQKKCALQIRGKERRLTCGSLRQEKKMSMESKLFSCPENNSVTGGKTASPNQKQNSIILRKTWEIKQEPVASLRGKKTGITKLNEVRGKKGIHLQKGGMHGGRVKKEQTQKGGENIDGSEGYFG